MVKVLQNIHNTRKFEEIDIAAPICYIKLDRVAAWNVGTPTPEKVRVHD